MFPTLYESTFISLQTMWVFVALALLVSSYLTVQRLKRAHINFTLLIKHSTSILVFATLSSRLIYLIFHLDSYMPSFDLRTLINIVSIWDQGFSFWGAILGATAVGFYHLYKSEENLWKWADALTVPAMIGLTIGEMGAFLGGYSYGSPTTLPWGISYETFNVKYTVPIHPTQVYVIVAIILILAYKKYLSQKTDFFKREGNAALYFTFLCSAAFFAIEFLRGDDTLQIAFIRLPEVFFLATAILAGLALKKRINNPNYGSNETSNSGLPL